MSAFGIAWSEGNATVPRTGLVVGTAQYLAHELMQGQKSSPAVDVYSWGTVAYECLAGRRPFDGPDPVEVAMRRASETPAPPPAAVPPPVPRLVEQTPATDPAARAPDGAALGAAGAPTTSTPPPGRAPG